MSEYIAPYLMKNAGTWLGRRALALKIRNQCSPDRPWKKEFWKEQAEACKRQHERIAVQEYNRWLARLPVFKVRVRISEQWLINKALENSSVSVRITERGFLIEKIAVTKENMGQPPLCAYTRELVKLLGKKPCLDGKP